MEARPIEIEKVDHLSIHDAIYEIPDGSAEDKSERRDQPFFSLRQTPKKSQNKADGQKRKKNEKRATEAFVAFSEDAEGRSCVADIGHAEQTLDDRNRVMERKRTIDDNLGCLIQEDNKKKQVTDELAFSGQDATPDLKTLEQRPQTIGCDRSSPTLGR